MTDIVQRLRGWFKDVNAVSAIDLMDEAAAEIDRLRLTDAEREAIEGAADLLIGSKPGATLRNLLERLHT